MFFDVKILMKLVDFREYYNIKNKQFMTPLTL